MSTLVYFGNYNLQKDIHSVSLGDWRSTPEALVQTQPLARGRGVSVVNTRVGAKEIDIAGSLHTSASITDMESVIKQLDKAWSQKGSRYLRSVPEYIELVPTNSITDWTASNDAANLALDTTNYQTGSSSVGFDIDVSASGNNYATLTYSSSTQVDFSPYASTGNIEFSVYIPDAYYIESVTIRIGNDASNYYEAIVLTNYEGLAIANGVNHFSVPASNLSETGSVTDTAIDYCVITITYSTEAIDISGCYVDNITWVDEERVRNYPCYLSGEVKKDGNHYNINFSNWRATFLNYTGYAISTHYINLFTTTSISDTVTTEVIDLDGNTELLPLFTLNINTATDIGGISIANLTTDESIGFNIANFAANDQIVFGGAEKEISNNTSVLDFDGKIPRFPQGINRAQLIVDAETPTYIPVSALTADNYRTVSVTKPSSSYITYGIISQSFTTTSSDPITAFTFDYSNTTSGILGVPVGWAIYNNNSGTPGATSIAAGVFTVGAPGTKTVSGLNILVSNATVYHLLLFVSFYRGDTVIGGDPFGSYAWNYDSGAAYAGGAAYTTTYTTSAPYDPSTFTWTPAAGDQIFRITQSPSPNWDIDWSAKYKKLYAA